MKWPPLPAWPTTGIDCNYKMDAVASFFKELGLSFIALFVAMDALGVLPFLLLLGKDITPEQRSRMVRYAMLTGIGFGLGFVAIGRGVFLALGILIDDFLIAGGLILLILAIRHLITGQLVETRTVGLSSEMLAVVPLGTPLLVGPATLAILLLLTAKYSLAPVIVAFLLNIVVAWLMFTQANRIASLLRQGGLRALSQIASLLLAAIAVMLIREGIMGLLEL